MSEFIPATLVRTRLAEIVAGVRKGARYTVSYRGRPAFRIVPVPGEEKTTFEGEDSLLGAPPVGRSRTRSTPRDFDGVIYASPRRR